MILSQRAQSYIEAARATRAHAADWSVVTAFMNDVGVPCSEAFISCLSALGGIQLCSPDDDIYFYSLHDIRRVPGMSARYFTHDNNGWWFQCAESRYPGSIQMWEHGSVHFERDVHHVWVPSVEKIVECQSLWASIPGADDLIQVSGIVEIETNERLAAQVVGRVDERASHAGATYIVLDDAVIVLYADCATANGRKRGMKALFRDLSGRDRFLSVIGDSSQGVKSCVVPRLRLRT